MNYHAKPETPAGDVPAFRLSLSDVVAEYEKKRDAIDSALAQFKRESTALETAACIGGTFGGSIWSTDRYGSAPRVGADNMRKCLLVSAWEHVIQGLKIRKIATAKDLDALRLAMESPPEFTLDNIGATFGKYLQNPREHILRGVAEAFADLDPAYKSHSKIRIGVKGLPKRIILSGALTEFGYGSYRENQLRDVLNAMASLHDQPRMEYSEFDMLKKAAKRGDDPEFYGITLRGFQNGNCHLLFDKTALLEINRALAEFYGPALADDFSADETKRPGTAVSAKLQYYPTPAAVVHRMVGRVSVRDGSRILEPSCGCGRILDGMRGYARERGLRDCRLVGVEYDPGRANEARAKGHGVQVANFLQVAPTPEFDLVLMNPPFAGRHYLKHINHALRFLKPGGYLVAVLPATAWYEHKALPDGGRWEDLPVASFSESGTNVPTGLFTISAPRA